MAETGASNTQDWGGSAAAGASSGGASSGGTSPGGASESGTFKHHYEVLQRAAQKLRDQKEPDIDGIVETVDGALSSYRVCKERIQSVRAMLADRGVDAQGGGQRAAASRDAGGQSSAAQSTGGGAGGGAGGGGAAAEDDDIPF